jgi:hypothetical protein
MRKNEYKKQVTTNGPFIQVMAKIPSVGDRLSTSEAIDYRNHKKMESLVSALSNSQVIPQALPSL